MRRKISWSGRLTGLLVTTALALIFVTTAVLAAGKPAPDFTLKDTAGKDHTLSQLKGKVVVLNFFTIWCEPCRKEMPDLNSIFKEYQKQGVEMLGICIKADPLQLRFLAKQMNLNYPFLVGTDKVDEDYGGVVVVPTTFIIDRQGNITKTIEGARKKEDFLKEIKPLL